ncbi:Gfo/Idh/MocA family oxidoreductase [Escherichia coli]|uniref:Gfo/Idh/MocA family protein n=1 Tax=Escherichia coli TaxID=562 RepID=UPI0032DB5A56|nr:Gfo/Idh/MocA family oxidoreductase [Escherichia coli]
MSTIQKVRTAIVGCGVISTSYIESLQKKFSIIEIVGCYDRNSGKAQNTAQRYGIDVLEWEQILTDPSIELVINLTPPKSHFSVISALLMAGKHVYSEKILTIELEEASELLALAERNNLRLGCAPDTFLGASVQTTKAIIDSGMIGDVTSCHCALNRDSALFAEVFPFTSKAGGGIGFDVGIYYITALLSILGPVKEVSGFSRTRDSKREHYFLENLGQAYDMECETLMSGTLLFESGCVGSIHFDSETIQLKPERPVMTIYGTKGIIYMADPNKFGGDVNVILKGNNEPFIMQQIHGFKNESRGLGAAELAWSMRHSVPHRASMTMGYHALEILHGIVSSGQRHSFVTLKSNFSVPNPLPAGFPGSDYMGANEESSLAVKK